MAKPHAGVFHCVWEKRLCTWAPRAIKIWRAEIVAEVFEDWAIATHALSHKDLVTHTYGTETDANLKSIKLEHMRASNRPKTQKERSMMIMTQKQQQQKTIEYQINITFSWTMGLNDKYIAI